MEICNVLLMIAGAAVFAVLMRPSFAVASTGLSTRGLRGAFFNRFMPAEQAGLFNTLATRIASNSDSESYKWLGSVPNMREFGNGRLAKGLRTESYNVENLKYEATIEVDRDEIADDQLGQINIRVQELAQRAATHKDMLLSQLMENGGSAGFLAYDGKTFFATDHESGASGQQSNAITSAASAPSTPTSAEFKAALAAASAKLLSYKDDQGEPMNQNFGGLVAVVHPSHVWAATEALQATVINNTSNVLAGLAKVVPFPWLSTATRFFLFKTDGVIRPFIFQDREPIEFTALDQADDDQAFNKEKYLYGVRARYRMTYGYWQYAVRCTFQ